MSQQDNLIRNMRRTAGLPVDDLSEEALVVRAERDANFVLREARDLAGVNDYRTEDFSLSLALSIGETADRLALSLARLSKGLKGHPDITDAAEEAAGSLRKLGEALSKAKRSK